MAKKANQSTAYYSQATVKCLNCGSQYTLGLTTETLNLEICANCHPFYTGQETLVDTAGRIEKFQARMNKASSTTTSLVSKKTKSRKLRVGLTEIGEVLESDASLVELEDKESVELEEKTV